MNKKYGVLLSVVGVLLFLVIALGLSFAFFNVGENKSSNTNVNGNVQSVGMVTLSGGGNLTLNVSAEDMAKGNGGTVYNAKTEDGNTIAKVATATLAGGDANIKYSCRFNLKVENTSTMKEILETDGGVNININPLVIVIQMKVYLVVI